MYRVAIVDEENNDIERFQFYVFKNDLDKKFEVIPIFPNPNFDEMLMDVLSGHFDALVSDYRLNEYRSDITYDGIDLVNAVLERKKEFPCFVLTSFDDDAVKDSDDVNIVYIKGIMNGETNAKITFLDRIEKQIQKHRFKIADATKELNELLLLKQERPLDVVEEDKFVDLSHFLDRAIVGTDSLPRVFYSNDTNRKLDSLINKTDEIISKLKER